MVLEIKRYTLEEFEAFTERPENADKVFEFIGGEIVEVPSNPFASEVSSIANRFIGNFVYAHGLGRVTGEAGGYMIFGERYAPDVAFISTARQKTLAKQGYNPNPPDLAVEVDFPSTFESQKALKIKIVNYLAAGTVVWVIYPETRTVEIYTPGQPVKILTEQDEIDGGTVLPNFKLAVKELFPAEES